MPRLFCASVSGFGGRKYHLRCPDILCPAQPENETPYSSISHMGFVLIGIASFSLGLSGRLQMVSRGLIGVFVLSCGCWFDRTHTLMLDEMGGIQMRKIFAMFTTCSMASLALPGMSGFVAELMVFVGFATSDAYSPTFRVIVVFLMAVGVILTPIYLLSMLREIFYGQETKN